MVIFVLRLFVEKKSLIRWVSVFFGIRFASFLFDTPLRVRWVSACAQVFLSLNIIFIL